MKAAITTLRTTSALSGSAPRPAASRLDRTRYDVPTRYPTKATPNAAAAQPVKNVPASDVMNGSRRLIVPVLPST